MLQRLRGKRLVFVGDSLNRNMWESLVCILRKSVKSKKRVYEAFGRHYFKTGASYSFVFKVSIGASNFLKISLFFSDFRLSFLMYLFLVFINRTIIAR